jgi:transposase
MKKADGRKLSHEALEHLRIHAVKSVVQQGKSPERVIESIGFGRTVIYDWLKKYKEGGWKALKSKTAKGRDPLITQAEEKKLERWLKKDPRQLHFDFGLWALVSVQELIERKLGKVVSITTTWRVLERIGYTCQKPLYRAYEQNPEAVEEWINEEYPKIKKEAKKEKRTILFGDESGFRSTGSKGTTWAKKGKRPVVKKTGKRYGVNSISAISPQGHFRFCLYEGGFNGKVYIDFLKKLEATIEGKITLIVDRHPVHLQKKVKQFIESTNGKIKVYYLPSYSPELNPDEQVWNHAKPLVHKRFPKSKKEFIAKVRSTLHSLQKQLSLIQSFFSHPDVRYVLEK